MSSTDSDDSADSDASGEFYHFHWRSVMLLFFSDFIFGMGDGRLNMTVLGEKLRANTEAVKFVIKFVSIIIAFYTAYYLLSAGESQFMSSLKSITASITAAVLSLFGINTSVTGALISVDGFSLEIIDECTAIFSSIVYSACVIAYPTSWRKRCIGIAIGIPSLYALNITRLVILTMVGIHSLSAFDFLHVYLWQASFIIFVVLMFMLWLMFVVQHRNGDRE